MLNGTLASRAVFDIDGAVSRLVPPFTAQDDGGYRVARGAGGVARRHAQLATIQVQGQVLALLDIYKGVVPWFAVTNAHRPGSLQIGEQLDSAGSVTGGGDGSVQDTNHRHGACCVGLGVHHAVIVPGLAAHGSQNAFYLRARRRCGVVLEPQGVVDPSFGEGVVLGAQLCNAGDGVIANAVRVGVHNSRGGEGVVHPIGAGQRGAGLGKLRALRGDVHRAGALQALKPAHEGVAVPGGRGDLGQVGGLYARSGIHHRAVYSDKGHRGSRFATLHSDDAGSE